MAKLYMALSGANPTTAAEVKVALTAATIKTVMQVLTPSTTNIKIIEWGISFDGSSAAQPATVELLTTGSVAATVTSFTPILYGDANAPASLCVGGSSATGYNSSAEGTITTATEYDTQLIAPTNQFIHQFPLGREPQIPVSTVLRIRVNCPTSVNAYAYIIWEE